MKNNWHHTFQSQHVTELPKLDAAIAVNLEERDHVA